MSEKDSVSPLEDPFADGSRSMATQTISEGEFDEDSRRSYRDSTAPARQLNLSQADLIRLLNHSTGNLVGLLSQHVRAEEGRWEDESLPVYGSDIGSR